VRAPRLGYLCSWAAAPLFQQREWTPTSPVLTWGICIWAAFTTCFGCSSPACAWQSPLEAWLGPGLGGLGCRVVLENEMGSGARWQMRKRGDFLQSKRNKIWIKKREKYFFKW